MTESIKALSRIFVSIVKIDLGKGDCIVIKNGEDKGMDLNGITRLEELCRVLSQLLLSAKTQNLAYAHTHTHTSLEK